MFTKMKIALAALIVVGAAFPASATTKLHVTRAKRPAIYNSVPGYNASREASPQLIEAPDRFGIQSQR